MDEKLLKKELTKARIAETDFLIRRKKQKQSYIDIKIEKYVPKGLAGTLTAAFTKAFEIIFRDGTGIIKKVEIYGIKIPISTYRTQGAITFKVLSLKYTEISLKRYFLYYKKDLRQRRQ